ncbi:helicase [Ahniella affigens]|uniref:Helicase n=1 Tax=Ahniella affigens TaxID=2021234 RepID=A0A2P1PWE2_9GAMM|nr:DUF3320 domain-containing protein [Ahniella affigens]AVP99167.1 helicase [Ahniella affigens]
MDPTSQEASDGALFRSSLPIQTKLDRARIHLLDLTARNRLLNIPRSKARSGSLIEVVDEKAAEVYRLLVRENKTMTFAPGRSAGGEIEPNAEEVEDLEQPGEDSVDERGVAGRHSDNRLSTRLTSKGLQKRLLTLYFDARTLEEEQGVNVLYLALGTLKWIDPNNAANIRFAPLVLVPVSLERATAGDRFKLKWRQEDPSSNLSLEAMVDRIHLLKLPAFEASDDFDYTAYCSAVAQAVSSKPGWEVSYDDIALGFFSFSKFLMYRDLASDAWPPNLPLASQPLIQALLRDGFPASEPELGEDAPIDSALAPQHLMHIVDADSSQTLAIQAARSGKSLIIQGPPGTGKSQTIANIIAAAVADGRTVLFVAEKMAALDVVKRRLDDKGVGDACLELHSNKANKRALLDELKRTWELSSPRGTAASNLLQRLTEARDRLNGHVDRLHRPHPVAEFTPYEVLGELTRLRDQGHPPNDIDLPDAVSWSKDAFTERSKLLAELCERVDALGPPKQHPWRGVALGVMLPNQTSRLLEKVNTIRSELAAIQQRHVEVANGLHQTPPADFNAVSELYALAQRVAGAPVLDSDAIGNSAWSEQRPALSELLTKGQQHQSAWETLRQHLLPAALDVRIDDAADTLASLPSEFSAEAFMRARSIAELLPTFVLELGRLKTVLGFEGPIDTLAAASKAVATGQRVAAAPDASPEVFAAAVWDSGVEQAAELAEAVARLEDSRAKVGERVLSTAWDTATERERQVVRLRGSNLFRFFSREWRQANRLLRSLVRDPKQPVEALLDALDIVGEAQQAAQTIRKADALGRAAFGADWHGEKSRSTPLRALVAWMRSLRGLGAQPRLIAARLPDRTDIGARANRAHQLLNQLRPLLEAFWNDLGTAVSSNFDEAPSAASARLSLLLGRATSVSKADATSRQVLANCDLSASERLALIERLRSVQDLRRRIDAQHELGKAAFGSLWRGYDTDWNATTAAAAWVDANNDIRALIARIEDRQTPWTLAQTYAPIDKGWMESFGALLQEVRADVASLFGIGSLGVLPIADITNRLKLWNEHGEQLSKWTAFIERADRARENGLRGVVDLLYSSSLEPAQALGAFEMAYFEALLNDMTRRDPELRGFDGELHNRHIREFAELDLQSLHANRVHVVQAHHRRLPPRDGGVGPLGVLRGEMARRRGHMPIRKLMTDASPAVQALKPVFMMSPLSIAQFLPPGRLQFDLLVMDEASQIQPVDAMGAIARCRQVVVVGDERQLPPTTFFSKMTDGEDDDEDESARVADIESILGLFRARGLSQRMLRWHYRSRHQSLIAVSNSQFYENKLIIVPSPYTAEAGMGLRFHYFPNGMFDSGGTGANQLEAEAIAAAVLRHAREHPEQSLGVATFSVRQRRAIVDQLEHLRRQHPEVEDYFQAHATEPFFVKNLENVQGDERDVIFISVAYGRNAQGTIAMRFGPLGADGGERRLNVLISRAKLRCEVFSSITDDDIDLERARGRGVVAFKLFLRFARTGRLDLPGAERAGKPDAFEAQVAEALTQRGYLVHPRVGIAGLFIDLAVADPEQTGRYVLGIECDGRSYHQARSARDRDRLRRSVLEDHGWVMHRIWSMDWYNRPQTELSRVIDAIESAKRALAVEAEAGGKRRRAVPFDVVTIERDDVSEIGLVPTAEQSGAPTYQEATINALRGHPEIHLVPIAALAELVTEVVTAEGPIHVDVVLQRLRDAWGLQRAGGRIQRAVEQAIDHATRASKVIRSGNFLNLMNAQVVGRDRSNAGLLVRRPEFIAPEEWQMAIVTLVRRNLGVRQSELAHAVGRWLGFSATSAAIREVVEGQAQEAQRLGRIVLEGDSWVLKQRT